MKKKVIVLCGGNSSEHEVSLKSAKNISDSLNQDKYNLSIMYISKSEEVIPITYDELKLLVEGKKLDLSISKKENLYLIGENNEEECVVFPIIHGAFGEDGKLQSILETLNIPYVGSSSSTSAICIDKEFTKIIVQSLGIKVAKSLTIKKHESYVSYEEIVDKLGVPFFVKPSRQGSSVGISQVTNESEYTNGLEEAFKYDNKVIVEEKISGYELECGVLGNDNPIVSEIGKIETKDQDFYSYENKYIDENGAVLEIPAKIDPLIKSTIANYSLSIYKKLDCKGLSRVDFFVDKEKIVFNEINTIPGFTNISMYPKLFNAVGISYDDLVDRLISLAIEEFKNK
ncbi:D-alanine--D-alanine ligase family protein (plasmid) [Macrococcus psychrotolerans]|uniref:D-alanine--D-alanine ligase n=1 Tax=Macrococcus psychrotolerans TaxID=3039389 RepID=A0AAT9P7I8_9STAP|nr:MULTISPECIES: D-alanine--D-alanine ligase family protein [Macrococcus]QYA34111.1 D-alanine--D-alanine ligase [Macrococcus sp. 19Msa1099]QYA38895.1 D-alanine--D-alanine ligase [Macrococcus caseolyticus]QYA77618.1 D-alanine--D-alanine ligase [Macrococcus caseolyticus]